MKNKLKNNKGVTLIALVVTIVILIILAAVSMTMVLGNNGIFTQAQKGANSMASAEANTQEGFNSMSAEIDKIISGSGSSEQPQPPEQPKETIEESKNSGKEFTAPKTEVTDSKGNKVVIPGGFKVAEDSGDTVQQGIVIEDVSASGDDNVKGSQFVWIPVGTFVKDDGSTSNEIVLGRYTFNTSDGTPHLEQAAYTEENPENYKNEVELNFDSTIYKELDEYRPGVASSALDGLNATAKDLAGFVKSAKENGGYYIARYEASFASGTDIGSYKAASKKSIANSTSSMNYTAGTLWNDITQLDASKVSINTYSKENTTVKSDLMNSYAWDTAIVYIQEAGHENYANKADGNGTLKNTGATGDEVCKINDMASNLREWTTEYSTYTTSSNAYPCTHRGGYYSYSYFYTARRYYTDATYSDYNYGFRFSLYM